VRQALLLVALVIPALGVNAQDAGNAPTFEVVSVKVRTEAGGGPNTSSPDRYNRMNASLRGLVQDAYGLQSYEIAGGPEWVTGAVRFDVMAKASTVPSRDQMRLMVQHMLRDRFALRTHKETREMPTYVLRIARADGRLGEKLSRTPVDCAAIEAERIRNGETPKAVPLRAGERPVCRTFLTARPRPGGALTLHYQASGIDSGEFAGWLAPYLGRTVIDQTGLMGDFDIDLAFSLDGNPGAPVDETVSIFAALQEQLGLKVDAERGPVEVLVIDSAALPTPD
jgi:uncharacterized protein (TIGR03435 family)